MPPSIEYVSAKGHKKEESFPSNIRLAATVTLGNGAVVVTGGLGSENQVWMSAQVAPAKWNKKRDMPEGRKGHAAAAITVGKTELVVVAGGWNKKGQELDSVNRYHSDLDKWDTGTLFPRCSRQGWTFTFMFRYRNNMYRHSM